MKVKTISDKTLVGFNFSSRKEPIKKNFGRMVMPIELCDVPGVISMHANYTMSRAVYPNRRTATIGAIAFLSFAAARGYRTQRNARTPLYLVAAANSGAGKDEPRKTNNDIAFECGAASNVGDTVASGEGLEDFIMQKAKVLLQNDEFDTLLNSINKDQGGSKETLVQKMLTLYSSAGNVMSKRKKSIGLNNPTGDGFTIWPSLTLFASAVPDMLFKSFSERSMSNGFVARCLIADCGVRQPKNPDAIYSDVPDGLKRAYVTIFGSRQEERNGPLKLPDKPKEKRAITVVEFDEDAKELLASKSVVWDKKYHSFDNEEDKTGEQSMCARIEELVERCAMIYSISVNPVTPKISVDAVNWASAFVEYCQDSTIRAFEIYNARNEFDESMKRVLRMFSPGRERTKREISRGLRMPIDDVGKVIETLIANGEIVETVKDSYALAEH